MQLKDIRIYKDTFYLKIDAPVGQWVKLIGLTPEEFERMFDGSVFKLIKYMNAQTGEKDVETSSSTFDEPNAA